MFWPQNMPPRLLSPNSCPIKTKVEHRWSNPTRLGTPGLAQSNCTFQYRWKHPAGALQPRKSRARGWRTSRRSRTTSSRCCDSTRKNTQRKLKNSSPVSCINLTCFIKKNKSYFYSNIYFSCSFVCTESFCIKNKSRFLEHYFFWRLWCFVSTENNKDRPKVSVKMRVPFQQ